MEDDGHPLNTIIMDRRSMFSGRCNMLLRVQFGGEQKYVKLSELSFDAYLKEVLLKFNIPEGRQPDIKVYDQSDTEVFQLFEVFEEIAPDHLESSGSLYAVKNLVPLDHHHLL
ncbi:hypothetical protein AOLI_G00099150 [Acnodon oligacanthus]